MSAFCDLRSKLVAAEEEDLNRIARKRESRNGTRCWSATDDRQTSDNQPLRGASAADLSSYEAFLKNKLRASGRIGLRDRFERFCC